MKSTVSVITCDDEYGCDQWIVDAYEMDAANWREVMVGWQYDPYHDAVPQLCPKHAQPGDPEWPSGVGGAQCDECGRTTIVRRAGEDELGEPTGWICKPCATGSGDPS